ncbi:long-chain-fatty-acid--CoA ligase 4 [Lepeophtheirus salmonis]|uniref:long-chain-fatty-acid--CoA ligase 4 n=1 Tax=Lepeophtheirus salmonis TaxID=72036 RepID=UPI001AE9F8E0|nr:long-chain-fatty-acid--CoA ligase 4-like [Lepeophtheirus salmonis]
MVRIVLGILKFVVRLWDFFTYPIYQVIYKPWKKRNNFGKLRSEIIEKTDSYVLIRSPEKENKLTIGLEGIMTMDKVWKWALQVYGERPILGSRSVLSMEDETQSNGKVFKKLELGSYHWKSFRDCDIIVENFGRGLRHIGLCPKDKVAVYAETRAQGLLATLGAFSQNISIVTLYTNLGPEGITHGINQTEAKCVISSNELLPKLLNLLPQLPNVNKVIVIPDHTSISNSQVPEVEVKIYMFDELVDAGSNWKPVKSEPPQPEDIAIIMYTSGSTGVPKGVLLTHRNLVSTLISINSTIDIKTSSNDKYIAFLPLAHVLELLCEMMMVIRGIRIGYSSPNTLLDTSTMIKSGTHGDATVLQPTLMTCVPLVLTRIYNGINQKMDTRGKLFKSIFRFFYDYRLKSIRNGLPTPVLNKILFGKFHKLIGGKVKFIFAGGAPLSDEVHDFIRVCLGVDIIQGYGLTETTASATLMDSSDISTGTAGAPNQCIDIKLVNWEDGNYKVTDQPRPRGEILIGGDCVSNGYYKIHEKTKEDFFEEKGKQWFRTGDIGEVTELGTIKIIDRKKDLVKLQYGEYISLGKVESALTTCPVVDNICIYGDSFKSNCVALIVPNKTVLGKWADQKLGMYSQTEIEHNSDAFSKCCQDERVITMVLEEVRLHCSKNKLQRFEIPVAVYLCKENWSPETGLVTAAFKIKRRPIQEFYQKDLDQMYQSSRRL